MLLRVLFGLNEEYERNRLRGPNNAMECIQQALGPVWTLENPRFGETWPPKEG